MPTKKKPVVTHDTKISALKERLYQAFLVDAQEREEDDCADCDKLTDILEDESERELVLGAGEKKKLTVELSGWEIVKLKESLTSSCLPDKLENKLLGLINKL